MPQEYITFEQVVQGVSALNTSADRMDQIFTEVTTNMTRMTQQENWQGASSNAAYDLFKRHEAQFKDFVNTVKKFGQALNLSNEELSALNKHLAQRAGQ